MSVWNGGGKRKRRRSIITEPSHSWTKWLLFQTCPYLKHPSSQIQFSLTYTVHPGDGGVAVAFRQPFDSFFFSHSPVYVRDIEGKYSNGVSFLFITPPNMSSVKWNKVRKWHEKTPRIGYLPMCLCLCACACVCLSIFSPDVQLLQKYSSYSSSSQTLGSLDYGRKSLNSPLPRQ